MKKMSYVLPNKKSQLLLYSGHNQAAEEINNSNTESILPRTMRLAKNRIKLPNMVPYRVFGEDIRDPIEDTSQLPWCNICQILSIWQDGHRTVGTGWLSRTHTIFTAGHNLFSENGGSPAFQVTVVPKRNGEMVNSEDYYEAHSFNAHPKWLSERSRKHDVGVIWLEEPIGTNLGWFGFAVYSDSKLQDLPVVTAGYPMDKPIGTQWTTKGQIKNYDEFFLYYELDTYPGQSGSPIFVYEGEKRIVVGIHAYGGLKENQCLRINDDVYDLLHQWAQ
jgi:glutamyl endopeptidase